MSMKFLSRRYRILLLIGIAGSLFLCFQFFSFQVISLSGRRQQGNQGQVGHQARVLDSDVIDKLKDKNLVLGSDKQRYNETVKQFHSDKQRYNETVKQTVHVGAGLMDRKNADGFKKSEGYHLVRGTHLHQAEDYRDRNGMFQCITSKEMIPFSQVNDDFCDCKDSTYEPGTSACPQSMFFCTFQNGKEPPHYIQGSRVNDGVCDCCDGSDEWMGLQVFAGVHLTDKRYEDTLHQTPCRDTCVAVQQSQAEDARIRERGRRLKHTYLEAGKKVRETDVYGPDGVFYQLSVTCFDHETTEYKYTLCPFKSVSQQNFPSPPVNLGRKPRWRTRLGGVYVLKMEGGDVNACPGGKQRQTLITFICGLADRILDVREDEKCVYGMRFSTPAAC